MFTQIFRGVADFALDIFGIIEGGAQMKEYWDKNESDEFFLAQLMVIVASLAIFGKLFSFMKQFVVMCFGDSGNCMQCGVVCGLVEEFVLACVFAVYLGDYEKTQKLLFHNFWVVGTFLSIIARAAELVEEGPLFR